MTQLEGHIALVTGEAGGSAARRLSRWQQPGATSRSITARRLPRRSRPHGWLRPWDAECWSFRKTFR